MSAKRIDGKAAALALRERVAGQVARFRAATGRAPGLAVVLVGDDPASAVYVRSKGKATREAGMESFEHLLPVSTSQDELVALVDRLNADPAVDGILVQLPLPPQIDERVVDGVTILDLKGKMTLGEGDELLKDKINFQVMGANVWRHARSIETMSAGVRTLYLDSERDGAFHRLSGSKPPKPGALTSVVDFRDRTTVSANTYPGEIVPGDLGTKGGLRTDTVGRVLDTSGAPIAGLYAAGNTMAAASGTVYPGGGNPIGASALFAHLAVLDAATR